MERAQQLLLAILLLVALTSAQQDIGLYLRKAAKYASPECQAKYMKCYDWSQSSEDYCSVVKNAKECATSRTVSDRGQVEVCTQAEYQRALDVACMSSGQRKAISDFLTKLDEIQGTECRDVIDDCFPDEIPAIFVSEYCIAINKKSSCVSSKIGSRENCQKMYDDIMSLACTGGAQKAVQNIALLLLVFALSLVSRDLLLQ